MREKLINHVAEINQVAQSKLTPEGVRELLNEGEGNKLIDSHFTNETMKTDFYNYLSLLFRRIYSNTLEFAKGQTPDEDIGGLVVSNAIIIQRDFEKSCSPDDIALSYRIQNIDTVIFAIQEHQRVYSAVSMMLNDYRTKLTEMYVKDVIVVNKTGYVLNPGVKNMTKKKRALLTEVFSLVIDSSPEVFIESYAVTDLYERLIKEKRIDKNSISLEKFLTRYSAIVKNIYRCALDILSDDWDWSNWYTSQDGRKAAITLLNNIDENLGDKETIKELETAALEILFKP